MRREREIEIRKREDTRTCIRFLIGKYIQNLHSFIPESNQHCDTLPFPITAITN